MDRRSEDTIVYHSGLLLLFLVLASINIAPEIFDGLRGPPGAFFIVVSILSFVQISFLLLPIKITEIALASIFIIDTVGVWALSRASGGSASPFIFIFPMLTILAVVRLERNSAFGVLGAALFFQFISIGFVPSVVSSLFTTLLIGSLGMYLTKALSRSDTALKASEVARKRLESLQKAILANIPSGLMSINPEGQIIQVNGVALKILGFKEDQLLLKDLNSVWPEVFKSIGRLTIQSPVEIGYGPQDSPQKTELAKNLDRPLLDFKTSKGEQLKLGYSMARLTDQQTHEGIGSLLVFQDLTQIVKLEETLRTSEKLAAIGKLAASIAHEIRNPLAGISGSAQLLSGHEKISEEDQKLLNIIQRESARLDTLISEFLEYVRPQNPKLEKVEILRVLDQVFENLSLNAKWKAFGLTVEIKNRDQLVGKFVGGDANKISQVLLNLFINSGQARAKKIHVEYKESSKSLSILDDGVGIKPENMKRLFEPFFTTKEGGTGLGLATSFRVLESMGARIRAESPILDFSPQGGGTKFTIQFQGEE